MIIPKKLHFIWVGRPFPEQFSRNIDAWRKLHPEWEVCLWGEHDLARFELQNWHLVENATSIVPRDAVGQFISDVSRYEIIHRIGGFYADVDTFPLQNIEASLGSHTAFAAREDRNWIGNTYLGAIPNHRIFKELVAELPGNVRKYAGKRANWLSGPRFLTPIWHRHHGYAAPSRQFFPYSYNNVKTGTVPTEFPEGTIAVHQWSHTQEVLAARQERRNDNIPNQHQ